jgi:3-methylcrotonyl-CoA carboxylase beta subunit
MTCAALTAQEEGLPANALPERVAQLQERLARIALGGSEAARRKHLARGRLLPRDRVARLLDAGTPFLEIAPLAALGLYGDEVPGAGLIAGVGRVSGRDCVVVCNDPTVKGGTYYPLTVRKHLRAQEVAARNRLPCIYLVDSGGANLPNQDQMFPDRDHFGRIFFNQANMSAQGLAQIAVVMGPCTGGGAYLPAMSDENIIVAGSGAIFLGSPSLVKAATGEDVTTEALGGGDVHTRLSGVADHLARDDGHAVELARRCVARLGTCSPMQSGESPAREPVHALRELAGQLMDDNLDVRVIVEHIVDGGELEEFKARFGPSLVCGFAAIHGVPAGIIANNGPLDGDAAAKGAHFVELCCQRGMALVFLHHTEGLAVNQPDDGLTRRCAQLAATVSTARVPKFAVIMGRSRGVAHHALCGRASDPNFLWAWPEASVRLGDDEPAEPDDAYRATARLWDDGIIDPADTRYMLGLSLRISLNAPVPPSRFGVLRL